MKEIHLFLFKKIIAFFKTIFWKNPQILYVNSNVKQVNTEDIKRRGLDIPSHSKIVKCQSAKGITLRSYRNHFLKMKYNLYQITRNTQDCDCISYVGFPSQMFSIFDGYILGDSHSYNIIGFNGDYYNFNYKIKHVKQNVEVPSGEEINLVVVTSYKIDQNKCKNLPTFIIDMPEPKKLNSNYLNDVRSAVKNFLDSSCLSNTKQINLYITGKAPVCFAIGTAIEKFHPNIKIFDFVENRFKFSFDLHNEKIDEVVNG